MRSYAEDTATTTKPFIGRNIERLIQRRHNLTSRPEKTGCLYNDAHIELGMEVVNAAANGLIRHGQPGFIERDDLVQVGMARMLETISTAPPKRGPELRFRIYRRAKDAMIRFIHKSCREWTYRIAGHEKARRDQSAGRTSTKQADGADGESEAFVSRSSLQCDYPSDRKEIFAYPHWIGGTRSVARDLRYGYYFKLLHSPHEDYKLVQLPPRSDFITVLLGCVAEWRPNVATPAELLNRGAVAPKDNPNGNLWLFRESRPGFTSSCRPVIRKNGGTRRKRKPWTWTWIPGKPRRVVFLVTHSIEEVPIGSSYAGGQVLSVKKLQCGLYEVAIDKTYPPRPLRNPPKRDPYVVLRGRWGGVMFNGVGFRPGSLKCLPDYERRNAISYAASGCTTAWERSHRAKWRAIREASPVTGAPVMMNEF